MESLLVEEESIPQLKDNVLSETAVSARTKLFTAIGLGLIIALGAYLRFYELGSFSIGNSYYAATVKSMLTSWHNFFYASFEPGGSVSVDKPPLGFWLQAISAYFLGVNGFALALPQALAGILCIPLLYNLVRRPFGVWPGLIAALSLAVMPVTVATERNNTIDGTLVCVLLLAIWVVMKSIRLGRYRYLLLAAFLVGLGFNIKMLQAYMVLPAVYSVYLFGAPHNWWKRLVHLAGATILLLVVSFSWVVAIDLTPPEDRPFVGSSKNNTMMELIIGHNGLSRLGMNDIALLSITDEPQNNNPINRNPSVDHVIPPLGGAQRNDDHPLPPPQAGAIPPENNNNRSQDDAVRPMPGMGNNPGNNSMAGGNGNPRSNEVGNAGLLRLFMAPLAEESSWLLPFVMLGLPLTGIVVGLKNPIKKKRINLLLWITWLLPMMAYFSFTTGLWHTYYLIMLGPAIAALTAITAWSLWQQMQKNYWLGWTLTLIFTGITVIYQITVIRQYPNYAQPMTAIMIITWLIGIALLATFKIQQWLRNLSVALIAIALLVSPLTLAVLTTLNKHPDIALPNASPDISQNSRPMMDSTLSGEQQIILDYLLTNTDQDVYLVAALDSHEAAPYILATGRPVLTFGGFNGRDDVISLDQLVHMIDQGKIKFILGGDQLMQSKPDIGRWVNTHCSIVSLPGISRLITPDNSALPGQAARSELYDCSIK